MGDRPSDVRAYSIAGVHPILVQHPGSEDWEIAKIMSQQQVGSWTLIQAQADGGSSPSAVVTSLSGSEVLQKHIVEATVWEAVIDTIDRVIENNAPDDSRDRRNE